MKTKVCLLFLLPLMFLASCQVKKGASETGLISNHAPVENAFILTLPANDTYAQGEIIRFVLTHPFDVTVTGIPRLTLNLGGAIVYANYVSGSGSKVLIFEYSVKALDLDTDGIGLDLNIDKNSGSITFNNSVITDVPTILSFSTTAGIKVDTIAPNISGATKPAVRNYYTNMPFIFQVVFNEPVVVTGTPSIDLSFDECTVPGTEVRKANYVSGTNTNTLTFLYMVNSLCNETTGGMPVTTSIQLNSGTITDTAGNNAPLDFSAYISSPITNTTKIRGRYPLITSITPPTANTYSPGMNLDFIVNFDRAVTVSATTAYINMTLGTDATKQVQYQAGSGSTQLTFRYTVVGGDVDADGVVLANNILNEGTICAGVFCLVDLETDIFTSPNSSNVIVHAPIPTITNILLPSPLPTSGYYKLGDSVQVVVQFSESVTVAGGTPQLQAVIGSSTKIFNYLSGSGTSNLIFVYVVKNDDFDSDGVGFTSPLILNGATIQNVSGTNATLTFSFTINSLFRFDGIAPTITNSVISTSPADNHPNYRLGQYLYIDVTFSEAVTVASSSIGLTIGSNARSASYFSSISTTVKRFRYLVQNTDHALQINTTVTVDTTLTGGTVRDTAQNDITTRTVPATNTTGVKIDGAVPTLTSWITLPANGTYADGAVLSFTAKFSEPIIVSGSPTWGISLTSGGPEVATYVSGSGSDELVFSYTVDNNDLDTSIVMATLFSMNGGSIADSSVGNNMTNSFTPPNTLGINVDGVGPTVASLTAPGAGTYLAGTNIDIIVNYSEVVTITGLPQLSLNIGGLTKYANYFSGSPATSIVYRYVVESSLSDMDGIAVTSHILNSGTIKDASGNNAILTLTPETFASVKVDSRGPQILSISPVATGRKVTGETISFNVNFDEIVDVAGTGPATLAIDIGGTIVTAAYASGTGSSTLVFTTSALTADHFDPDGISFSGSTLTLNGATLKDTLNHAANLSYTPVDITSIKIIYSEVISWLDVSTTAGGDGATISGISDLSAAGNNASASAGLVTKILLDAGLNNKSTANFDGFSRLAMGNMSIKTIVIAFKASSVPNNDNLIASALMGINLVNGTDLNFGALARYAIGTANLSGGVSATCLACYNSATTSVITLQFLGNENIAPFLGDSFDGRIAEVWILNGSQSLTDAQIARIGLYLDTKY